MTFFEQVPPWLLRPLPANAVSSDSLNAKVDKLCENLPSNLPQLFITLQEASDGSEYDIAANRASVHIWNAIERFYGHPSPAVRRGLFDYACKHMSLPAQYRVIRRLAKDPVITIRNRVAEYLRSEPIREVALPLQKKGNWDASGWTRGTVDVPFSRHKQGTRQQNRVGVPPLRNLADLRKLLEIRSEKQLGYFLLASDADNGPYTSFTIPKRDGGERVISAPKEQLRWVQRHILDRILAKVEPHSAAHGFVPGRSTVTNAEPHLSSDLLVKFDLKDFFPTMHFYRVLGLFASLGYPVDDAKFGTRDLSKQIAPTLARLCCYTPDPSRWNQAVLPQGAPTSPAISNLVCRRLDARLTGLAKQSKGVYTRYADDLTFSFHEDKPHLGRFRWWVDQICHQEGFFVKQSKFRVIRSSQRQVVTGIVVNEELRVPRDERRRFRAILHNCRTSGVASQERGHPRFREYLRGFASYVNMIHPDEGQALLREVEAILKSEKEAKG